MSKLQKFSFTYRANGHVHTKEVFAETYAEACYRLGMIQGRKFDREQVPADFELKLDDEQARLDETPPSSTITRDRL